MTTAAGAVVLSALMAGALGAPLVRQRLVTGALATFVLALVGAIVFYPVVPSMLGYHVGEAAICVGACDASVNSDDLASGLRSAVFFPFAPLAEPMAVGALALGVTIWASLVRGLSQGASSYERWPR